MAVKIRLRRVGAKKAPFYRVVVADSRFPVTAVSSKRSAPTIPTRSLPRSRSTLRRQKQWIANGAQPTDTVRVLLKKSNVL